MLSRLPFLQLDSDVRDVVYLTWMVDAGAARARVAPGVQLRTFGGKTPFTILTYRHGHFGPRALGRLRRLFPSPLQSNWRLYLDPACHPAVPARTVYFVKNVMDSALYTLVTRWFSDIMDTRLAGAFTHARSGNTWRTRIAPAGGAPMLAYAAGDGARDLPPGFDTAFARWDEAVGYLACQDAALAWAAPQDCMALAHIDLPIDLAEVRPLTLQTGTLHCPLLDDLGAIGAPLVFAVPRVRFRVLSERLLR